MEGEERKERRRMGGEMRGRVGIEKYEKRGEGGDRG